MAKHIDNETFETKKYQAWFSYLHNIPLKLRLKMIEELDTAKSVYEANDTRLLEISGVNLNTISLIQAMKKKSPDEIYEQILESDADLTSIEDKDYPLLLRDIPDCPYSLFYKGTLPPPKIPSIGIVGARMCTNYGSRIAYEIAHSLSKASYNIVSGMALGTDRHAHAGALDANGITTAVLGCGVDICYPPKNKDLYKRIIERGCIISEYTIHTQAVSTHFPRRNRIISGMTSSLIVTEARLKSGSLITANLSSSYNRDVYALPGRINDPLSLGTNHLISEGALMLESIETLLDDLNSKFETNIEKPTVESILSLSEREKNVYDKIDYYAIHIESLIELCSNYDIKEIYTCINSLKEKGKIKEIFPDYFVRN